MTTIDLLPLLDKEITFGADKYGWYHNSHEHYAVLQEEVDEWWAAIKGNFDDAAMYELIQVAAVALRYILENGDIEQLTKAQEVRHSIDK